MGDVTPTVFSKVWESEGATPRESCFQWGRGVGAAGEGNAPPPTEAQLGDATDPLPWPELSLALSLSLAR